MSEIAEFEKFHPRAVKLLRKQKNFIVIAEDEPYFTKVYRLIRKSEMAKGTWSEEDECIYRASCDCGRTDGKHDLFCAAEIAKRDKSRS